MTENKNYIFNLETTKIELHFEKEEYDALSAAQKASLKSAFLWSSRGKCWVSRAKEPNLWRAIEVAKALGFTEERRKGERLTFGEQLDRKAERAEARAERLERYSANAEQRAEALQKPLNNMRGDIAFFTQPNINTSSGRAFTAQRERLFARYEKGFDEYKKSEYFKNKAEDLRASARMGQYNDIAYLDRRIKECQKEIRARKRQVLECEALIERVQNGEKPQQYGAEVDIDRLRERYNRELELIEVAMDKQGFLENRLEELGGFKYTKDDIKVGYIVTVDGWGLCEVLSKGPVNFTFKVLRSGSVLTGAYAEITEINKTCEKINLVHPFKIGEKFTAELFENRSFVKAEYEIIKASVSSITLKRVGTDEKPIVRKPKLNYDGSAWKFGIDDHYKNIFYKPVKGD